MFDEIVTMLAEEPAKIEKVIIRTIKVLFNIIIAAWLYKILISPFEIFPIDSYKDWINFLLSGRIFICILIYLISHYFIVGTLKNISSFLVHIVSKIKWFKPDQSTLTVILKYSGIYKFNAPNEIPVPGKNISWLDKIAELFDDDENREEIKSLKNTFIENVCNLYFVFTFIYFIILSKNIHTIFLNTVVIVGMAFIFLIYCFIHDFIEFMIENYKDIIASSSFIKTNNIINVTLNNYGIFPLRPGKGSGLTKFKTFQYKEKEYVLVYLPFNKVVKSNEIQRLLSNRKKAGRVFIVIVPKGFVDDSQLLILENHDNLIMMEYRDEKNLVDQIKQTIGSL